MEIYLIIGLTIACLVAVYTIRSQAALIRKQSAWLETFEGRNRYAGARNDDARIPSERGEG